MTSKIEWYVLELERLLKGRVPNEDLGELKNEVRAHLSAARLEIATASQDSDPEKVAIQDFGSPRMLAIRYLREHRSGRSRTAQWIALGIAVLLFALPALSMFAHEYYWQIGGERTWFTLLVLYFVAVTLVGRSLVLPLLATVVATATVLALFSTPQLVSVPFWGTGQGEALYSRSDLQFMKTKYEGDQKERMFLIKKLQRGAGFFDSAAEPKDIPVEFRSEGEFLVPSFDSLSYDVGIKWRKKYYLQDAKPVWRRAHAIAAQIQSKQYEDDRRLSLIGVAQKSNPWSNFGRVMIMSFAWAEICMVLLLLLNLAGCAFHELGIRLSLRRRIA